MELAPKGRGLFASRGSRLPSIQLLRVWEEKNVYPVLGARNGDMWVGTWPGALSRIRNGKILTYTSQDGLPPYVNALAEDQKGTLWVGTGGGVRVLRDGRFSFLKMFPMER